MIFWLFIVGLVALYAAFVLAAGKFCGLSGNRYGGCYEGGFEGRK